VTGLTTPWTPEQVHHLNHFQQAGRMHPFTCGQRDQHRDNPGILIATKNGWHCPADGCDYTQNWAHTFMAAPLPPSPFHDALDNARHEQQRGREALAAVARIRALHQPYRSVYDTDGNSCAHCNVYAAPSGIIVPYPCDTIRALDEP
jgi:hypothetical protein